MAKGGVLEYPETDDEGVVLDVDPSMAGHTACSDLEEQDTEDNSIEDNMMAQEPNLQEVDSHEAEGLTED
jgi:hypothetical protein